MPAYKLALTAAGKSLVKKASRAHVARYFSESQASIRRSKWLATSNRYRTDCIVRYKADLDASCVNDYQLLRYIGASAPTHVIDGWSFLSRGLEAVLRGDVYSAIHFGYYAELRAAMSLLAAEGIGIFNNEHPIAITPSSSGVIRNGLQIWQPSTRRYRQLPSGTHKLVWPCLDFWSKKAEAGSLLDAIVRPAGLSIAKWFQIAGIAIPKAAIMQSWLRTWGVDLDATTADRARRNLASYRPSELMPPASVSSVDVLAFFESLWLLFEPQPGSSRFPNIESRLLRDAIRASGQKTPTAGELAASGFELAEATKWEAFFGSAEPSSPILEARGSASVDGARCHLQVLSRAALLLFLASGGVRQHFRSGSISATNLKFWAARFGEERLLWAPNEMPEDPFDLWQDIRISLEDLNEWRFNRGGAPTSLYEISTELPLVVRRLASFEAVTLWSLLP